MQHNYKAHAQAHNALAKVANELAPLLNADRKAKGWQVTTNGELFKKHAESIQAIKASVKNPRKVLAWVRHTGYGGFILELKTSFQMAPTHAGYLTESIWLTDDSEPRKIETITAKKLENAAKRLRVLEDKKSEIQSEIHGLRHLLNK